MKVIWSMTDHERGQEQVRGGYWCFHSVKVGVNSNGYLWILVLYIDMPTLNNIFSSIKCTYDKIWLKLGKF
jgi:hypothetical protein